MLRPRFRLQSLMIVVVLAAIASALLSVIRTVDDREKADSYKLVAAWAVAAFGLFAMIVYRQKRARMTGPGGRRD